MTAGFNFKHIDESLRERLLPVLHILVLAGALALIAYITYDTLLNVSFVTSERFLKVQMWICIFFEVEIFLEWLLSPRRLHFMLRNVAFIIVCIPFSTILHHFNIPVSGEMDYLLRFVPMIRAAYVLAITWDIMSKNWITSMFGAYIIMLVVTLYFLSLMFYVEENPVNPSVYNYWQSLYYSIMQMTTCGSDITAVSPAGKAIGVILSAEGLILFPVFTVYFTHAFARTRNAISPDASSENAPSTVPAPSSQAKHYPNQEIRQ